MTVSTIVKRLAVGIALLVPMVSDAGVRIPPDPAWCPRLSLRALDPDSGVLVAVFMNGHGCEVDVEYATSREGAPAATLWGLFDEEWRVIRADSAVASATCRSGESVTYRSSLAELAATPSFRQASQLRLTMDVRLGDEEREVIGAPFVKSGLRWSSGADRRADVIIQHIDRVRQEALVSLRNGHDVDIYYYGTPGWVPGRAQAFVGGTWKDASLGGYCGTGTGIVPVKPGETVMTAIRLDRVPSEAESLRVGLPVRLDPMFLGVELHSTPRAFRTEERGRALWDRWRRLHRWP